MRFTFAKAAILLVAATFCAAPKMSFGSCDVQKMLAFLSAPVNAPFRLEPKFHRFAEERAQTGLALMGHLLHDEPVEYASAQEKIKAIVALNWGLFCLAVDKDQGFDQGSFVIEDPRGVFYRFINDRRISFARPSSHLNGLKSMTRTGQFGLDVLGYFDTANYGWVPVIHNSSVWRGFWRKHVDELALLPANKRHVLIGEMKASDKTLLATNHLFIKMEDHGLSTWRGFREHMKDFLYLKYKLKVLASRDKTGWKTRNETGDQAVVEKFAAILRHLSSLHPSSHRFEELKGAKNLGIRYMLARVAVFRKLTTSSPALEKAIEDFLETLRMKGWDHLEHRTGNEVIFVESELRRLVLGT